MIENNLDRIETISLFIKKFYDAVKSFKDNSNVKNGDLVSLEITLDASSAKIISSNTLALLTKVLNVCYIGTSYNDSSITYEFLTAIEKEKIKTM